MHRIMNRFVFNTLLISSSCLAVEPHPPSEVLQRWWENDHTEKIGFFYFNTKEIQLTNKTPALLIPAFMSDRPQDAMFQTALVLPKSQHVILLEDSIVKELKAVVDLDDDNVSEIIVHHSDTTDNIEKGVRAIVQIAHDGNVTTLREMPFEIRNAKGERHFTYWLKDIRWEFVDIDKDGKKDLYEYRITHEGRMNRHPKVTENLFRYVFKNGEFIRYLTYKYEQDKARLGW